MARHAQVQEDLHRQRAQMDQARLGLVQRRGQAQDQLRRERERLSTRAWWRRPTSLATSSWVSSGGARATATPTASTSAAAWPPLEMSMVANMGEETLDEEMEVEVRTVRMLNNTVDNLSNEVIEMDVDRARGEEDEARERTKASGRGKGRDGRHRDE